jgi:hypothetical protein
LGNIYFNNFGFKIVNTPTALANVKNSFDFINKARTMANQTELTQSENSMCTAEKMNPFLSRHDDLLESMQQQMGK